MTHESHAANIGQAEPERAEDALNGCGQSKNAQPGDEPGLSAGTLDDLAADDRRAMLEPVPPVARRFGFLLPVLAVSLAVHGAVVLILATVIKDPPMIAPQQETAVDIVAEPPPERKDAKAEPPKAEPPKPEPPKPEPPKPEPPKPEPPKPVPPPEPPKPEQPTREKAPDAKPPVVAKAPEPPQPEPVKPAPQAEPPASPQANPQPGPPHADHSATMPKAAPDPEADKVADAAKALQSLQAELAGLKAQAAELRTQRALQPDPGEALGLLPDSFAAIATPSLSPDGEDPVTYQQAVYGLIAKAKKTGRVYVPGVAHVVFNIGAKGELLDVTLDHPSGNAVVDEEAVAIVKRAAPFPPPPPGAPRSFPAYMSFVADP